MTWKKYYDDKLMVQGSSKKYLFIGGSKNYKIQSHREGESDSEENRGNCDVDSESEIDSESKGETFLPHNILVNTLESTSFNGF